MFKNKKILVFGMARSGYEVAKLLSQYQNMITITDSKEQDQTKVEELQSLGIKYVITDHPEELLDTATDYVVKNPGIRKDHPAVLKAKKLGIPVIGELEVAYQFLPSPVKVIGITGSNGKTTTTTMIYEILKKAGYPVHVAGNIGLPLSLIVQSMKEHDILVLEISDHQLLDMYQFKLDTSIVTNLSEVHLDFHGSYENYKKTKQKIFKNQTEKDIAILNKRDKDVLEISKDIKSHKIYFSSTEKADAYIENGTIMIHDKAVLHTSEIVLTGVHNYENIMCTLLALEDLHVEIDVIKAYFKTFGGVEHRNEFVIEKEGRKFYNDSKSTNTESTITALTSFNEPTILLLGGLDRGHAFEPLDPYLKQVKAVICFGETKDRIYAWATANQKECMIANTLEEATRKAYEVSQRGDVILLSPACASWDQFSSFEDRGAAYKKGIEML